MTTTARALSTHRCSNCGTGLRELDCGYPGVFSLWVDAAGNRHDHDTEWHPVALIDAVPAERTDGAAVLGERLTTEAVQAWVLVAGGDADDDREPTIPWRIVVGTYEQAQAEADRANLAHLAEHGRINPIDRITVHDHAVPVVTYP